MNVRRPSEFTGGVKAAKQVFDPDFKREMQRVEQARKKSPDQDLKPSTSATHKRTLKTKGLFKGDPGMTRVIRHSADFFSKDLKLLVD